MANADYYLKIDTIEGETEAVGFEKQLQLESWSFGASNAGSAQPELVWELVKFRCRISTSLS